MRHLCLQAVAQLCMNSSFIRHCGRLSLVSNALRCEAVAGRKNPIAWALVTSSSSSSLKIVLARACARVRVVLVLRLCGHAHY